MSCNITKNNNDNTEVLLAQWQTCVEMANSISQRRDSMNNIFVTLNLAIVAAVSFTLDIKSILLLIAGIAVCSIWIRSINNYKILNAEKFNVINAIEKNLPVAPFNDEWDKLKSNIKYKDSTKLEKTLPKMFIILYVCTMVTFVLVKFII